MESKCDVNAQFVLVCMESIEKAEMQHIVQTNIIQAWKGFCLLGDDRLIIIAHVKIINCCFYKYCIYINNCTIYKQSNSD